MILIRGQISKVSREVSLKNTLLLILGKDELAAGELSQRASMLKQVDPKSIKPKTVELRRFMDPSSLAE